MAAAWQRAGAAWRRCRGAELRHDWPRTPHRRLRRNSQGAKAVTKAEAYEAKVAVVIAELDKTDTHLDAVDDRAAELKDLLGKLTERAVAAMDLLESEPFEPQLHAARFQQAITLVVAVRDVAAAPIINADSGEISEQSANLTVKYREMTKEHEHA